MLNNGKPVSTKKTSSEEGNDSNPRSDAWEGIKRALILAISIPAEVINFIGSPPGCAIPLTGIVVYCATVSVEGYWLSMGAGNSPFLPKPFIDDGWEFSSLGVALRQVDFWLAAIVSLTVQGIQAFVLREWSVKRHLAAYEAVKDYRVPAGSHDEIDLAKHRRKTIKRVGMRTLKTRGAVIALTYFADISQALWNFPLVGVSIGRFVVHLLWGMISVFGTEAILNVWVSVIDEVRKKSKVEILK